MVFAFAPLEGLDVARVVALELEGLARQFGLSIANAGIDPRILLDAIEHLKGKTTGGVRDIVRAIEQDVADGFIDARARGCKTVRLVAAGTMVKVEGVEFGPLPAATQ
jgi:ATP-dependent Clp protease ATP-binding subunit ClpA